MRESLPRGGVWTRRGFYEALGGVHAGEKSEEMGGAAIREVAYGWPDLADLLTRTRRT